MQCHGSQSDDRVISSKEKQRRMTVCGSLCDGKSCIQVVSFEPSLRSAMDDFLTKKASISVVDCQVQHRHDGGSEFNVT